ncbi:hypothetical protein BH23PSE2_BH23PSE2_08760 [soil metagenome]
MNTTPRQHDSVTFPNGFLDFLTDDGRRHRLGDHDIDPIRLQHFNDVLHSISPDSPGLTQDQIVTAGRRLLARHGSGEQSSFITSRLAVLARLEEVVKDQDWEAEPEVAETLAILQRYRKDPNTLLPASVPVVGELDDAVLIDVALQRLRDELTDYEDFCRFRQVAAAFARVPLAETGLTRAHWLEAMAQAGAGLGRRDRKARPRFAPDPRTTLFHIT